MASTLSALVIQKAGCTVTSGLQRPDLGTNKLPRVWATIKRWSKNQEQPLMASTQSALVIQKAGCVITSGLWRPDLGINELPRVRGEGNHKKLVQKSQQPLMASTLSALVIQKAGGAITSGIYRPDLGIKTLPGVWATRKSWSKNWEWPLMASTLSPLIIHQ